MFILFDVLNRSVEIAMVYLNTSKYFTNAKGGIREITILVLLRLKEY
jgi:hypothetical protein